MRLGRMENDAGPMVSLAVCVQIMIVERDHRGGV